MDWSQVLRILFGLVHSLLPADTAAAALALVIPVLTIVRLLRLIPWVENHRGWAAPALSILIGLLAGFMVAPGDPATALLAGLLIGLAAVGGWSGVKNVWQTLRGWR